MNKSFNYAGVSKLNNVFKFRTTSDVDYPAKLAKIGCTNIDLLLLKEPMTKEAAVAYLLSINFANGDAEIATALATAQTRLAVQDGNRDAPKKETKKPKKPKTGPSLDAIAARGQAAARLAPTSTLTRAEIVSQLASKEDQPY